VLADQPGLRAPLRAELEHRTAIERGAVVEVVVGSDAGPEGVDLWVLADGKVAASARVRPLELTTID
jgi:hypothetical protein